VRIVSLLLTAVLLAHEGKEANRKPSAADPQLKLARKKLNLLKRGRYACCNKKSCDLCAMRYGKCECAISLKQNKQVCGQCLPQHKANGVTLRKPTAALPQSKETQEVAKLLLEAKRTLVKEKRYACCKRGGCDECTFEADCPCGKDLAAKGEKGVCGTCYDGWHAGEGSFRNLDIAEVKLADMAPMSMPYVSGTAQIPNQAPMYMTDQRKGNWTFMTMGQLNVVTSQQSGPRGGDKVFAGNWFMPMASRKLGPGILTLRSMISLEPATVTQGRYPLLFQEGETYKGLPIQDGQHPHNAFMEIGALYQIPISDQVSVYFYGGPRGEPALGPVPYPHRLSASENPMAALGHHYQDSTHIANNVMTGGVTLGNLTIEASGFSGREPGEQRWRLEKGRPDSVSGRISYKLTGRSLVQYSQGSINGVADRQSASYTYVRPHAGGYWASTLLYGRNVEPKHTAHSFLAESTAFLRNKHWLWARMEYLDRDSFHGKVTATTLGYGHEIPSPSKWLSLSLGGQFNFYRIPAEVKPIYGSSPIGAQITLRARLKSSRMTF
jgi:hypothetical protein